mmetsp:Transcript_12450/g.37312  ORF Transcript_12450/g.37312 Transcript_12450/m.37312 type:complete len:236 (-) Transcript_12450:237-944(-)
MSAAPSSLEPWRSTSGMILFQNSGSAMSMSALALRSETKAALEKTEPCVASSASVPCVMCVAPSRIWSMSAASNWSKASVVSSMKMSYAPCLSMRSISARSAGGPPLAACPCTAWPMPAPERPSLPRSALRARSRPSFLLARSTICDSYVLRVTRRNTLTVFSWPMRWDRAMAWMSFCGFQSESRMMHVSAAVRLMPRPPARVERRKTNTSVVEKRSMADWRASPRIVPSRRSKE